MTSGQSFTMQSHLFVSFMSPCGVSMFWIWFLCLKWCTSNCSDNYMNTIFPFMPSHTLLQGRHQPQCYHHRRHPHLFFPWFFTHAFISSGGWRREGFSNVVPGWKHLCYMAQRSEGDAFHAEGKRVICSHNYFLSYLQLFFITLLWLFLLFPYCSM